MKEKLNALFWWVGLKLLVFIGCLVLMGGMAEAKTCEAGQKYRMVRNAEGSVAGCTDGKKWHGYVQIRDTKARLLMAGNYVDGLMDGVWKVYNPKGHVTKKVLMAHGEVAVDDYEVPDGETGGGADD